MMTTNEREAIKRLIPYMRTIPERVQSLIVRVTVLRSQFAGRGLGLGNHVDLIEADLMALEQDARNLAQAAIMVQRLLEIATGDENEE